MTVHRSAQGSGLIEFREHRGPDPAGPRCEIPFSFPWHKGGAEVFAWENRP